MAKKPANNSSWKLASGFKDSWKPHKSPALDDAMRAFNECKRATPPDPLPRGMKDHGLKGALAGVRECHLDGDILLLYRTLPDGGIKLLRICTHDDLKGPKGKALAKTLKNE